MKTLYFWLFMAGALPGLSACYEDPTDVTLHEAHVYRGKTDEHAGDATWQAEQLRARLRQVQSDR